jgi:hypothetical protein
VAILVLGSGWMLWLLAKQALDGTESAGRSAVNEIPNKPPSKQNHNPTPKSEKGILAITKAQFRDRMKTLTMVVTSPSIGRIEMNWNGQNASAAGWSNQFYYCGIRIREITDMFGQPLRTKAVDAMGAMIWKCADGEVHVRWKTKDEEYINFIGIDEP